MNKNERTTKEFLNEQLIIEKQRLEACQENLRVHKEILASVMMNTNCKCSNNSTSGEQNTYLMALQNNDRLV